MQTTSDVWIAGPIGPAAIADVIDLAVENLENCTWGQGNDRFTVRTICAGDSIWMALRGIRTAEEHWGLAVMLRDDGMDPVTRHQRAGAVEDAITDHLKVGRCYLYAWNDEPGRTKQEVIDAFKETAKELRNQASPLLEEKEL